VPYRYEKVLQNIQEKVVQEYGTAEERPSRHKVLYGDERLDLDKSEWSRKFRGETKFTFDEISFLLDHFGAPPGWPYLSWNEADAARRAWELLERLATAGPAASPGAPGPMRPAPSGQPERRKRRGHP
jgi:hypothetical protein